MKKILFASIAALLLAACSMPAPGQNSGAVSTSAAQTVEAAIAAATSKAAAVPSQPLATPTLRASTPTPAECQDSATYTQWLRDKVLYDINVINQPLAPKQTFVVSWTLQNTGTCVWNEKYLMYFQSGTPVTQSPGYPIVSAGQTVAPGQSVTVEIEMTAPKAAGDYETSWRLQSDRGAALINFGLPFKVGGGGAAGILARPGNFRYAYDCTTGQVKITLAWVDVPDEDGYRVYRDGKQLEELPANATAYEDIAPGSGKYLYTVAAYNAAGENAANVTAVTENCK